jgi:hypothetical protein
VSTQTLVDLPPRRVACHDDLRFNLFKIPGSFNSSS